MKFPASAGIVVCLSVRSDFVRTVDSVLESEQLCGYGGIGFPNPPLVGPMSLWVLLRPQGTREAEILKMDPT